MSLPLCSCQRRPEGGGDWTTESRSSASNLRTRPKNSRSQISQVSCLLSFGGRLDSMSGQAMQEVSVHCPTTCLSACLSIFMFIDRFPPCVCPYARLSVPCLGYWVMGSVLSPVRPSVCVSVHPLARPMCTESRRKWMRYAWRTSQTKHTATRLSPSVLSACS